MGGAEQCMLINQSLERPQTLSEVGRLKNLG